MPQRPVRLLARDGRLLREGFEQVRKEVGAPGAFPPAALAEAVEATRAADASIARAVDATGIAFVTIDPPGARDLDQALYVEHAGHGYRVSYAIADVAAFVKPGGALDAEAHERGLTLYSPDRRTPLHPPALCEDAASLLPGQPRPALLWTLDLDADGDLRGTDVRRAIVRSRRQLDYAAVQVGLDAGRAPEPLRLLREVGRLLEAREHDRGGVHLPLPEQEVVESPEGGWTVTYRAPLACEGWNAQISLLTGRAAADLMLAAGIGVLRTVPEPDPRVLARLRRAARALHVAWPHGMDYADWVQTLDAAEPRHAALLHEATAVMRGATYTPFDGATPEAARHAALADEYAHVTAPLRRLVDRYASEVCVAACAGVPVPEWVRAALPALPKTMGDAARRAHALERGCVDLVETALLAGRVGEHFDGVVVEAEDDHGLVQLREPAVRARLDGAGLPLGAQLDVRLVEADPARRSLRFTTAG